MVLDHLAYLQSSRTKDSKQIVLVAITNEDYQQKHLRGEHVTLRRDGLEDLLEHIANANPKLIVVDVETADSDYRGLAATPRLAGKNILWARPLQSNTPLPVLGIDPPQVPTGVTALPADEHDRIIRSYRRLVEISSGEVVETLPYAAAVAFDDKDRLKKDLRLRVLMFWGHPINFENTSTQHLNSHGFNAYSYADVQASKPGDLRKALERKIVIVGGTYSDEHITPIGKMYGIELVANILETELRLPRGGPSRVTPTLLLYFNLALGALLMFVYARYQLRVAVAINLGVFAMLVAGMLFESLAYLAFNFAPSPLVFLAVYTYWRVSSFHHRLFHQIVKVLSPPARTA